MTKAKKIAAIALSPQQKKEKLDKYQRKVDKLTTQDAPDNNDQVSEGNLHKLVFLLVYFF